VNVTMGFGNISSVIFYGSEFRFRDRARMIQVKKTKRIDRTENYKCMNSASSRDQT
jgi:hypothetical protein